MPTFDEQVREEFVPALQPPLEGRIQPSPYNFDFTGEDALRLTVHNSQSGVVVAAHWRMKARDQRIIANRFFFTPASDRSASSVEFTIGEGYLLNVTMFAESGAPRRGQTFARLQVIRGRSTAATVLGTVVQGYITGNQDRAWPGSPLEGSLEGDGYYRMISGTDPGAGSEISETVPTGARWQVVSLYANLLASAVAGNRRPRLELQSSGLSRFRSAQAGTVPANGGGQYVWAIGMPLDTAIAASAYVAGLPIDYVALAGDTVVTVTDNFDAGDNWSAPRYCVREWLEAA